VREFNDSVDEVDTTDLETFAFRGLDEEIGAKREPTPQQKLAQKVK